MFYETPYYYVWKICVKLGYACFVQKLWAYKIGGTCWFLCCECQNERATHQNSWDFCIWDLDTICKGLTHEFCFFSVQIMFPARQAVFHPFGNLTYWLGEKTEKSCIRLQASASRMSKPCCAGGGVALFAIQTSPFKSCNHDCSLNDGVWHPPHFSTTGSRKYRGLVKFRLQE